MTWRKAFSSSRLWKVCFSTRRASSCWYVHYCSVVSKYSGNVQRYSFWNILWMRAEYSCCVRYEILTALLMKISIILDVTLFQLVNGYGHFGGI
jgi:hypothetical protein